MPSIKFTETVVVNNEHRGTPLEERFEAGSTYDLPFTSCERWVRRKKAVDVISAVPLPQAVAVPVVMVAPPQQPGAETPDKDDAKPRAAAAIEIPADWQDQQHMKLIALANRLGADVNTKVEAIAAIEAEIALRATETPDGE